MKRFAQFFITLVLITLMASTGVAQNQPPANPQSRAQQPGMDGPQGDKPGGPPGEFGEFRVDWKALELTEEQRQQMLQLRRDFQIETAAIRQELKFAEQDLRTEMMNDPVDQAAIDAMLQQIATLKAQLGEAAIQNMLDIKALLTPEQVEQLADFQVHLPVELHKLDLTSEQRSQIGAVLRESMKEQRDLTNDAQDLKIALQEQLLAVDVTDVEQVNATHSAIMEKEAALQQARTDMLLKIKNLLTPEQLKLYQKTRSRSRTQPSPPRQP